MKGIFVFIFLGLVINQSGFALPLGTIKGETSDKHPNVVFFLVDDLGWKDVRAYGSDYYQTPNVDGLVTDGVMFVNAYSSCTVCSPSRASIMTGKYPAKLHCTDWIEGWKYPHAKLKIPDWTMYLAPEEVTMAEAFKKSGYVTGHFGKWHLGEDEKYWPENHGFDINVGGWAKGSPNKSRDLGSNGYFPPYGNPRLSDPGKEEYLTQRLANEACEFIDAHKDSPFFLNFWFYNVHTPLQAEDDKIEKYQELVDSANYQKNPVYAAMVEHMDDAVGQVVHKLKNLGLYDNTIIIFTSDNGGLVGNGKKKVTNNYPLRSGKGDIYEGGVRVPLIIRSPGITHAGAVDSNLVISTDFLPTLIDLAHLSSTKEVIAALDGVSLLPILQKSGKKLSRDEIFWHYPHYHIEGATPYSAVRKGDWKLIHIMESDNYELYNLKEDFGEANDLSNQYPGILENLKLDLIRWKVKMKAQMPMPNPDYDPTKRK
ncbi:sulfatase [uncultured Draconibacterium sp.]|uniref:sulfatase n=1 Tax=uncultured Draconibacterium sp. TaxID=1573823 RepID=UPI0029C04F38|nr:sulfatase [uncultured Draconibacterium sp.]